MRLAETLGKSIEEVERFSARELAEWMAYSRVRRLDDPYWQAGLIAAAVVNAMGGGNRSPEDFLPWAGDDEQDQSPEEALMRFSIFSAGHNARAKPCP